MTAEEKLREYDFSFMSDIELALMQSELNRFPEDNAFRIAVLKELGNRSKVHRPNS